MLVLSRKKNEAIACYEQVIATAPLSIYMVMAHSRLAAIDSEKAKELMTRLAPAGGKLSTSFDRSLFERHPQLETGVELLRMGHEVLDWRKGGDPEFVVACLDFEFSYEKLKNACFAIFQGARFVATNTDPTLPVEDRLLPGAGSIVAAISKATGKRPLVIGKPSRRIMDIALKRLGVDGSETVVVGDRLSTDVRAGKRIGAFTVLVLTGASSLADLERWRYGQPDLVLNSISELPRALKRLGKP